MTKRKVSFFIRLLIWLLAVFLAAPAAAWARPATPQQARTAVLHWLGLDAGPLGVPLGRRIKSVKTFKYRNAPAYYVVYLNPRGLVIVPADDLVEPIIAFLPAGVYNPSPANPLGALVSRDIPGRLQQARALEARGPESLAPGSPQFQARRKWSLLLAPGAASKAPEFGVSNVSDVRVAPFTQSRWSQATAKGLPCYNYYTPNNYPCGCAVTAIAQLMRYWQWPQAGIGVNSFQVSVDGAAQILPTLGGDGSGGPYNWNNMVLDPENSSLTVAQRQAIGALTFDAGLSMNISYSAWGSSADFSPSALTGTFGYGNAIYGQNSWANLPAANRNTMITPNLNALYPVVLGIIGNSGSHAVVCDGYGYQALSLYHHLNLGWAGSNDAWYNLPAVDTSIGAFTSVAACIYNVFPRGSGEMIAGRVTDAGGSPLSGATVTAACKGRTYPAMQKDVAAPTPASGVYGIPNLPAGSTFTVTASKDGYAPSSCTVTTGISKNYSITTGNKPDIDFVLSGAPAISLNQALDNSRLSFKTTGNANWFGEDLVWYYGGSAARSGPITAGQNSQLQTTVVGPGALSFCWQVSSLADHGCLDLYLDATRIDRISGEVNWTLVAQNIPAGIHIIAWKYSMDSAASAGSGCGWVDQVAFTPLDPNLSLIIPPNR